MNAKTAIRPKPTTKQARQPRLKPNPTPVEAAPVASTTKAETILTLLRRTNGATIRELAAATGWQTHSVRGFLSGEVKKKRGLSVQADRIDGALRYRLPKGA